MVVGSWRRRRPFFRFSVGPVLELFMVVITAVFAFAVVTAVTAVTAIIAIASR